ncbi:MAG: hypothetical protein QOH25_3619 [Acidobacteriota bacterium]|nr:hypothetical protein [Acidobacteriota bacterium]
MKHYNILFLYVTVRQFGGEGAEPCNYHANLFFIHDVSERESVGEDY